MRDVCRKLSYAMANVSLASRKSFSSVVEIFPKAQIIAWVAFVVARHGYFHGDFARNCSLCISLCTASRGAT